MSKTYNGIFILKATQFNKPFCGKTQRQLLGSELIFTMNTTGIPGVGEDVAPMIQKVHSKDSLGK